MMNRVKCNRRTQLALLVLVCWSNTLLLPAIGQGVDLSLVLSGLDEPGSSWHPVVPRLRQQGELAVDSLMALRRVVEAETESSEFERRVMGAGRLSRLDQLIDLVANQCHASGSGLFWFAELERAQDVARRSHRPILLLLRPPTDNDGQAERLLALSFYGNEQISELLRGEFVLCAPVIDGRFIDDAFSQLDERTDEPSNVESYLHVAVDASARPLGAFMGLATPQQLRDWLVESKARNDRVYQLSDAAHLAAVSGAHRDRTHDEREGVDRPVIDFPTRMLLERYRPWPSPDKALTEISTEDELADVWASRGRFRHQQQISDLFADGTFTRTIGVLEQKLRAER